MNIEAYDVESLRKLVRLLEYENRILKEKLKKGNIPYDEVHPFEETMDHVEEYDPDQGAYCPSYLYHRDDGETLLFYVLGKRRRLCQAWKEWWLFPSMREQME